MAYKDFATSLVAVAPVTPTAGVALTVTTGEGARFPATPFYATVHPSTQVPTLDNAEVVQVTNIATDVLTIVRAQYSTTAQSIVVGYRISASIYAADLAAFATTAAVAAGYQPLDSDLTTIAGLTPTTDNFMIGASSAWASRTPTQARTSLGLGAVALLASIDLTANVTGILPVANGGSGRNTATTAYGLLAAGTTAAGIHQTISPGTSGQFLKSGGASALAAFANITLSDIAASTLLALGVGTIELGHATDTTLSRSAAGQLAVEGVDVLTTSNTKTVTNKTFDSTSPTAFMFPGFMMAYAGFTAPSGWLMSYGQAISRTTYAGLFAAIAPSLGTVTTTIATPAVLTRTAHGLRTGDQVYLTTTGALPTGLTANTIYYAHVIDADTFHLSTTQANSFAATYIATSGTQSGTHTLVYCPYGLGDGSTTFNVPDLRGNVLAGKDDMGGSAANRLNLSTTQGVRGYNLGNTGGEQAHQLITAEMPNHTHGVFPNIEYYVGTGGTINVGGGTNAAFWNTGVTGGTGGDGVHNNIQPTIIVNYIIKT